MIFCFVQETDTRLILSFSQPQITARTSTWVARWFASLSHAGTLARLETHQR